MSTPSSKSLRLDLLPSDIKYLILSQIAGPNTLLALISASSQYFRVYSEFKTLIVSRVTWNRIPFQLMPIALDCLEQGKKARGQHRDIAAVLSFIRGYRKQEPSSDDSVRGTVSLKTSIELTRFYDLVEYFELDFVPNRLALIEECVHLQDLRNEQMGTELLPLAQQLLFKQESAGPIFSRVLSTTEHIRLARAFYHLELYGHLFHKLDIPQEEHVRFLQALRDFELDEFLCVASYLLSRLRNYEDKMEGAGLEVVGSERANDHWCFGENVNCIWIDPWEDRALASGLGALKKLLTADSVKSRQAAVGRIDDLQWTTLSSCLIEMAQGHQSNIYSPISMIDSYREAESRNLSWALQLDGRKRKEAGFWAKHDRCFALGFSRRRGCAIWDEDRLEAIRDRTPNGHLISKGRYAYNSTRNEYFLFNNPRK